MWQEYKSDHQDFTMKISHEMTRCSFTLDCSEFELDFVESFGDKELNRLYHDERLFMFFTIPTMQENYIKLTLNKERVKEAHKALLMQKIKLFLFYALLLMVISALFARFALYPLKKALELNDEFVKDMLHDFNTPLSSLKINFKILQKKFGKDEAIKRSEEAIETIGGLQSNLSYYLAHNPLSREQIDLEKFIEARVEHYKRLFEEIDFVVEISTVQVEVNRDAFMRVVDNLLSNASKYNVEKGWVKIYWEENRLVFEDSGIGIKEPSKVFNRFYKETERGMGIGLHVVKKLCEDLGIEIEVESKVGIGSKFILLFIKNNV